MIIINQSSKNKYFIVKLRQGSARDGPYGKRPQSFKPCLELTLKLVATTHNKFIFTYIMARQWPVEVGGGKGRCVGSL